MGQNQKKMFSDLDEIWRVYKGHYGVNVLLTRRMDYDWEGRNMDLNGFSILGQIKKKMFSDFIFNLSEN